MTTALGMVVSLAPHESWPGDAKRQLIGTQRSGDVTIELDLRALFVVDPPS
ncbi:MAG: hypothetical protein OXG65_03840 [Chloroflexi bacterium]|nr:hypothetical protein [Chloroflexota bacterium]